MLIHGGTISSGRLNTVWVVGAYWMSSIRSLRKMTLPGVAARLTPSSNFDASAWRMRRVPRPAAMSSAIILQAAHQIVAALGERRAQQFGIGGDEVRRRQARSSAAADRTAPCGGCAGRVVGALDEIVGPVGRQHIGLLEEIEIGIVAPFRIGEALVAGVGRGDRRAPRPAGGAGSRPTDRGTGATARPGRRAPAGRRRGNIRRSGRAWSTMSVSSALRLVRAILASPVSSRLHIERRAPSRLLR